MNFSNRIIAWYLKNKRSLPWRETTNPYHIWLSEIILQQTRVAQGLPYFVSFTTSFPTIFDLARASEEQVLKLWQGLGYYSRARNLHATAQFIVNNLGGNFPNNSKQLLELKGVGEYTSAAIASFAFAEIIPVVDGNVFRVLSRYFGIETDIALVSSKKEFRDLAFKLISKENPALFNQSIMEFGALHCTPKNPNCTDCVFKNSCIAFKENKVAKLPIKSKKGLVKKRFFNYIVISDELENTIIQKRTNKDIWFNLYEFPLIETTSDKQTEQIIPKIHHAFPEFSILKIEPFLPNAIVHKLSHQHLNIKFWNVRISENIANGTHKDDLKNYPFPIVIHNFIENN